MLLICSRFLTNQAVTDNSDKKHKPGFLSGMVKWRNVFQYYYDIHQRVQQKTVNLTFTQCNWNICSIGVARTFDSCVCCLSFDSGWLQPPFSSLGHYKDTQSSNHKRHYVEHSCENINPYDLMLFRYNLQRWILFLLDKVIHGSLAIHTYTQCEIVIWVHTNIESQSYR